MAIDQINSEVRPGKLQRWRQAMLIYLKPEIARKLKIKAIEMDQHVYLLAEEAISWFLIRKKTEK